MGIWGRGRGLSSLRAQNSVVTRTLLAPNVSSAEAAKPRASPARPHRVETQWQ